MAFPFNPSNNQVANRFGRQYKYIAAKGRWDPINTTALAELASVSVNTLSDIDIVTTAPQDGETLVWNAAQSKFVPGAASGGGASVSVSETAPTEPSEGDQWFNSSTLKMYVYYSNQWIAASTAGPAGADGASAAPTSYANLAAFPSSGNTVGNLAIALDTKALYVWDGSEWDRIKAGAEESPVFTAEPDATYLTTKGADPFILTATAYDPEGFDITYNYGTSPSNQTNATITNNNDGTFTVTPSTTDAGSFSLRMLASDGVNTSTRTSIIRVSAYQAKYILDGTLSVFHNETGVTPTVISNGIATVDTNKSQIAQDGDYISIQDIPNMTFTRTVGQNFPVFAVRFDSASVPAGIGIVMRNSDDNYQYAIGQASTLWGFFANGESTIRHFSPAAAVSNWYIFTPVVHWTAGTAAWRVKQVGGDYINMTTASNGGYAPPTTTLASSMTFFGNNPNIPSAVQGYLSRATMPHTFGGMALYSVDDISADDALAEFETLMFS
jgi:hypothetical protein